MIRFEHLFKKNTGALDRPWLPFLLFLGMNAFLSYCAISLEMKFWVALAGIGFPLALFLLRAEGLSKKAASALPGEKGLSSPSLPWILLLFAGVALSRLLGLTSLSTWPMPDESTIAFFAIESFQKMCWNFFYFREGIPFLSIECLSLFFRLFPPGLFSLWLFSALFSIATFAVGFWACRRFFPPSWAFLCACLGSFNFWMMYTGRLCMPTNLLLFWEVLTIVFLVLFLLNTDSSARRWSAGCLGFCVGIGFFIWITWIPVALMIALAVFWSAHAKTRKCGGMILFFLIPVLLLVSVFLGAAMLEKRDLTYVHSLWAFQTGSDWATQWNYSFSNVAALFWGTPHQKHYGPVWGGVLNPVSGALFFTGLVECRRRWALSWVRWLLLGLVLFLLPGIFSRHFELFRVLPVLPLLVLVAAFGLGSLISWIPAKGRWICAASILLSSSLLDGFHLAKPYHDLWGTPGPGWAGLKNVEYWKAHEILGAEQQKTGPGILLADFRTDVSDQTLPLADYAMDVSRHPQMTVEGKNWVAVIVDLHYQPFLKKRFPSGHWFALGNDYLPGGGIMMALIPVTPLNQRVFAHWCDANRALHSVTQEIMQPASKPSSILAKLSGIYPFMKGDAFLESVYWRKVLYHEKIRGNRTACLEAIHQGLRNGYPLPPLLNDEGVLWMQEGRYEQARQAFQKALRSEFNLTPAGSNLELLKTMMKNHKPIPSIH